MIETVLSVMFETKALVALKAILWCPLPTLTTPRTFWVSASTTVTLASPSPPTQICCFSVAWPPWAAR
ncbi:hypothetical protein D3C72_2198930 [compost metagenome]